MRIVLNHRISFSLLACFICMNLRTQTVNMHLWATGENHNNPVKTVSLLDGYTMPKNGDDVFSRYGSDSRLKTTATGFYYTKKIDGRWWLIDPDGYAGINMAVTSLPDMDQTKADWAYNLLRKNGYNGTGNFFETEDMTKRLFNETHFEKISYTRRRNFFQKYRVYRQAFYSTPDLVKRYPENYITVFDPEFESFADGFATGFANYKGESGLLGYFSDNEINFTEDQLKLFLNVLPETDPNYKAAMDFLNSRGLDKSWVINNYDAIPEIRKAFLTLILERYFSVVTAAIKKYDPNHLYLGTRIHGKPRDCETVVTIASKYCDIVSVNYYNYVFPSDQICNPAKWGKWLQQYDKPCMITEFYAKQYNATYPEQSGAGFYTDDQSGRGVFYQSTCLDVLRSKYYVGWQYFRWQDDPAPKFSNKGVVNTSDQEYTGMTSYMEELNRQVYYLVDYMDGRQYENNTYEVVLPIEEDTYLQLSGPGQNIVKGNDLQLSSSTATSALGRRDIVLKFGLGNYADSLSRIKDAKVRLYYLSGDNNQRLSICGIKDNDWQEGSLTGSYTGLSGLMNNYGKARAKVFFTGTANTPVELNVRNWIQEEVDGRNVSFRVSDETSGLNAAYWASGQHDNPQLRPVLILKLAREEMTSLGKETRTNDVRLFVKDRCLYASGFRGKAYGEIFSISGQKVAEFTFTSENPYTLKMKNGIYVVHITTDESTITEKIVI